MLRLAPALVVLLLLAGCGDDDPAVDGGAVAPDGKTDVVIETVTEVAPALESFYRGSGYPQSVVGVVATIGPAGITLPEGVTVGSYVYDAEATEFTLCLQDANGAWASYDTAPMGVRDAGDTGGCPQ